MRDYGPALIAMFPIDARFRSGTTTFRRGDYDKKTKSGRHAMVLLGIRPDAQDGHMCLVQNWHARAELLEMSLPYLATTGCQIVFVLKPLTTISTDLPTISAAFTEALSDAVGEAEPREDDW